MKPRPEKATSEKRGAQEKRERKERSQRTSESSGYKVQSCGNQTVIKPEGLEKLAAC